MKAAIALLTLISIAIFIIALLSTPPDLLVIAQPLSIDSEGGPNDTGPSGTSIAYAYLASMGYDIVDSPSEADGLVLINPRVCAGMATYQLIRDLRSAGGGRPFIVIIGSVGCADLLNELGLPEGHARLPRAAWAVGIHGEAWPTLYTITEVPNNAEVLAVTTSPIAVVAYAADTGEGRVVVYADGGPFTNEVITKFVRAGSSPEPMLSLLLKAAGAGEGARLYVPQYVYAGPASEAASGVAAMPISFRGSLISALSQFAAAQMAFLQVLAQNPLITILAVLFLAPIMGWVIAKLLYHRSEVTSRERVVEPERVGEVGLTTYFNIVRDAARKGRISLGEAEARRLIWALYYLTDIVLKRAYGKGIEEAYGGKKWVGVVGDEEVDKALRRLYIVFTRKVKDRKLLPLFVNVRKEAVRLYRTLIPFLESMGVKLSGLRGLEYGGG